jgi:ADP-ribose pyrophosphatase YjhB (NUDIX family)
MPKWKIDYSHRKIAPVVNCFLINEGKILIMKRSNKVGTYRGCWNGVAGYLDDEKKVIGKALQEVREETGLTKRKVKIIRVGDTLRVVDKKINKVWLVHPVLLQSKTRKIRRDWEHTAAKWIKPSELKRYKTTPKLEEVLQRALG